ncbi:MAG: PAS-domain containing protein [Shimia sp.]|uniref:PAS-domain containing protein n=1 Tax=Shimia sp. TaxID=1954381 RepID=UPI004059BE1C
MFDSSIQFVILLFGSVALLLAFCRSGNLLPARKSRAAAKSATQAICIYRQGVLVEANPEGLRLLAGRGGRETNWRALRRLLADRFPDFPENQGSVEDQDTTVLCPSNSQDGSIVTIDQWQDTARVTVLTQTVANTDAPLIETEISLRNPYPIWTCDADGQITWCNKAYKQFAIRLGLPTEDSTPHMFDIGRPAVSERPFRVGITQQNEGQTHWFDVTSVALADEYAYFAVDANTVVDAEMAQRSIVQTLSKTFAQMPTGLAIFDRDRRMVLFNPALTTLTAVSPPFLSSQPPIEAFFDNLRESRVAPEPKRSQSWQSHVAGIVQAAEAGHYSDIWELASGKTYRVSGRPQPDGAIALLFDDISAEMALTRQFRSEIEIAHAALDALEDPVALFSQSGEHLLCNNAYRIFWKADPDSTFADYTIRDATTLWETKVCDTPLWQAFRETALSTAARTHWSGTLALRKYGLLQVTLTPIANGATLVTFRRPAAREVTQPA